MNLLPTDTRRFYFSSNTFISIVHELEELPKVTALRRDSWAVAPTDVQISQWQRLFSLTREEAVFEIECFRLLRDAGHTAFHPERYPMWTLEYMKTCGFDEHSYYYWIWCKGHYDFLLRIPSDTASVVRLYDGAFSLFVLQNVDEYIDRIHYAKLTRQPRLHMVHDWRGSAKKAIVLSD